MNYKINLYVREIKSINRTIIVNDNVSIQLFIKSMILSMNGSTNGLYIFEKEELNIIFNDSDSLSSLRMRVGDVYQIIYNYDNKPWNLEFVVLEENDNLNNKKIEVIDGSSYGICQEEDVLFINNLITTDNRKWKDDIIKHYKSLATYLNSKFILEENNKFVSEYVNLYEDLYSPKSIVMNISLNGYAKYIKRKIVVNNNISIDKFCRAIIASMNGDMSHLYTIKMNKKWYDENILDEKLTYLELQVGTKFSVVYDYGDNWKFDIKVSKVIDGYNDKEFEIMNGMGYGIVDDCGGIYGLENVFNGKSDFESYNINDFNLNELQKLVEEELKIDNLHIERENYY